MTTMNRAGGHTPGKWWVREWEHGDIDVLCNGSRVASVDEWKDHNKTLANAKLIAAAPALADALENLIRLLAGVAAIAKTNEKADIVLTDARAALRLAGRLQ